MIYTIRTFQVDPQNYRDFVRQSEEEIWPGLEKLGARSLGLWTTIIGGAERILLMTRYDSLAHWQETRNWDTGGGGCSASAGVPSSSEVCPSSPAAISGAAGITGRGAVSRSCIVVKTASAVSARRVVSAISSSFFCTEVSLTIAPRWVWAM